MNEACHHDDGEHPGLKGAALKRALGQAETRCMSTQERLTVPRKRVLELLLEVFFSFFQKDFYLFRLLKFIF